jgi:hypothetical protein
MANIDMMIIKMRFNMNLPFNSLHDLREFYFGSLLIDNFLTLLPSASQRSI